MTTPTRPLWQLSACELAAGIHAGDCSAVEAMQSVLGRTQERNPALNAIVYPCFDAAVERAREAD